MKVAGRKITCSWTCWDAASFPSQIGAFALPAAHPLDDEALRALRDDGRASQADPGQAKALAGRVYQKLWNRGDPGVVDELFDPRFVGHTPASQPAQGPDGMRRLVQMWRSGLSDLEFVVDAQHAEGGRVASRLTVRGKHTGGFLGCPPTGTPVTTQAGGIHLWHNGMRVLAGLGIADQVCAVGWRQRVADFIGEHADGLEFARRIVSGSRARPLASSASLAAAREQFRVRRLLRATAAACRDRRAGLRRCADAAQYHSVEIKEFAR